MQSNCNKLWIEQNSEKEPQYLLVCNLHVELNACRVFEYDFRVRIRFFERSQSTVFPPCLEREIKTEDKKRCINHLTG